MPMAALPLSLLHACIMYTLKEQLALQCVPSCCALLLLICGQWIALLCNLSVVPVDGGLHPFLPLSPLTLSQYLSQ